jgi:hypothetical protein
LFSLLLLLLLVLPVTVLSPSATTVLSPAVAGFRLGLWHGLRLRFWHGFWLALVQGALVVVVSVAVAGVIVTVVGLWLRLALLYRLSFRLRLLGLLSLLLLLLAVLPVAMLSATAVLSLAATGFRRRLWFGFGFWLGLTPLEVVLLSRGLRRSEVSLVVVLNGVVLLVSVVKWVTDRASRERGGWREWSSRSADRRYGTVRGRVFIFRVLLVGFVMLLSLPVFVLSVLFGTMVLVWVITVWVLALRMWLGDSVGSRVDVACNEVIRGRVARYEWHGCRESRGGCDDGDDKGGLETHDVHKSFVGKKKKKKACRKKKK